MKRLTYNDYTKDNLYPAVARAIADILKQNDHVAPVEVLLQMERITKKQCEDWRFKRIRCKSAQKPDLVGLTFSLSAFFAMICGDW